MKSEKLPKTALRGKLGENAAARYLSRRFYRILERNWFFYRKEIDIIAKRGTVLVICEVKTRTMDPDVPSPYGSPAAAVTREKQKNLLSAARAYVRYAGWRGTVRMDIIEVYLAQKNPNKKPKVSRIVHIKNAFTA